MPRPPDHLDVNRALWNRLAGEYAVAAETAWTRTEPTWGLFNVPESELHLLPDDLRGKDAVELGCGTAYVSAWLALRGACVVGLDNSPSQLATARRMQRANGQRFPLVLAAAEDVPLRDASFDFAISEYGACLWADPDRWLPEAARLLRPGGRLVFLTNSHVLDLCIPDGEGAAGDRLLRSAFALGRMETDEPGVEFHLTHGEWIARLRACGFEVEALIEVRPPANAVTRYPYVTAEWARRWPCEEVWKARRVGG